MKIKMKKLSIFAGIMLVSVGCGGSATSTTTQPLIARAYSPFERIASSERDLKVVGLIFDDKNHFIRCESLHRETCEKRLAALTNYINRTFEFYVSESQMPIQNQERVQRATECFKILQTDLTESESGNLGLNCQD